MKTLTLIIAMVFSLTDCTPSLDGAPLLGRSSEAYLDASVDASADASVDASAHHHPCMDIFDELDASDAQLNAKFQSCKIFLLDAGLGHDAK